MALLISLGLDVMPSSLVCTTDADFGFRRRARGCDLVIAAAATAKWLDEFEGQRVTTEDPIVLVGPASRNNAAALRRHVPWLASVPIGMRTSFGFGDRLGLATPGHVRALHRAGNGTAGVFAQQSIREMTRTGRTPQHVMDDAMWGAFAEGWQGGFGSDADHLKTVGDIDRCVAAGFTGFTIDPGEHVDGSADAANEAQVKAALERLPWAALEDTQADLVRRFGDRTVEIEGMRLRLDGPTLARAAMKYGRAVAHVAGMYRHLVKRAGGAVFDFEVSVDETETPTSHAEHYYIAAELKRLSVKWTALAPRFVGRFEKGVDYIGDLAALDHDIAGHAAIARHMGAYKLSLHSGSDKFSVYPLFARHTRGLAHVKTAGTSYLEALRTCASVAPDLFRDIYAFARAHYEHDRASYHVSAALDRAPAADGVATDDLPSLLEQFDARQILHVTFGSVLTDMRDEGELRFYEPLMSTLGRNHQLYSSHLENHFARHLAPLTGVAS